MIARVQVATAASGATAVDTLAPVFSSAVTAGNLLAIALRRNVFSNPDPVVTDSLGTVYTRGPWQAATGVDPKLWWFYGIAPASGANTVTVVWDSPEAYSWVCALEYAGLPGATLDGPGCDDQLGTGVTDLVTGAVTPSVASGLLLMAVSQNNFATYTAGADFTLIDGSIGDGDLFGGVQERIVSTSLSGYVAHMTSTITADYTAVLAMFKAGSVEGYGWGTRTLVAGARPRWTAVSSGFTPPVTESS